MTPIIVFVHGAFSTTNAFNYFKVKLPEYGQLSFTYNWNDPPSLCGKALAAFICGNVPPGTPVIIFGHSLGGNVAINAIPYLHECGIILQQVITYGSPLGGSKHATVAQLFSRDTLFNHLVPRSVEVRRLKEIAVQYAKLITCFVTYKGPLSNLNDGVVSVASQKAVPLLTYIPVATSHMEVLLSDDVILKTRDILHRI